MGQHPNPRSTRSFQQGLGGEILVAHWLQQQGWRILHHRWRDRRGELDLVAQFSGGDSGESIGSTRSPKAPVDRGFNTQRQRNTSLESTLKADLSPPRSTLAFVEVKTRKQGNWDANGL
ncbi:MAG: YraN family protein, partial [Prochlorothrix sp.]